MLPRSHTVSFFLLILMTLHVSQGDAKSPSAARNQCPEKHWTEVKRPEDRGWSSDGLAQAKAYADSLDTAAVVIVDGGVIVSQWGAVTTKFNAHSIRKSLLSALYGIPITNCSYSGS